MQCPRCRFDNPAQMRFCVECGAPLVLACPSCGAEMLMSFKFCGDCGASLRAADSPNGPQKAGRQAGGEAAAGVRPSPARGAAASFSGAAVAERKPAAVLACELDLDAAGSEPPSPDLVHDLLTRFATLARTEVERYGGTIHRFLEQGFLALFGAPVALEDHDRRAVLAAHALADRLAQTVDEIEAAHGVRWGARMGLDSGPIVVGGADRPAVGDAIVMATRLARHAPPGAVLVGDGLAAVGDSEVALVADSPIALGDGRRAEVRRVVGSGGLGAAGLRAPNHGPFVGRRRELGVLEDLLRQADRGHGQVVAVAGEPGAGKSRLLHELYRQTFPGCRMSYLRGQCQSYGNAIPYQPLVDMIRKASRIFASDDGATVAAKMRGSIERVGTDAGEALPYFLRLLGVREGTETLDELEPQAVQSRTFAVLRRMLLDASRNSLVVMELEDVHWIDETSEAFLDSLVEVMGAARLMLLVTYRSGYQPRWLERSYSTQITLRRLSDDDSRELVAAVLRGTDLPPELTGDILAKAEGNPLFLEELARSLAEHGAAREIAIPHSIQGILAARIDRLPDGHKHLLKTASVLGRELSLDLLEALWDREEPLLGLLEDLRRWEFLYKTPSEDQTIHFFKHALTQEVAYESLLIPRRRGLHTRAAAALEALHAEHLEDAYDRLIYHYPRAGEPEKTVHYLTLFAARAARDYAHAEAAKALREALDHAERLPEQHRDRRLVEVLLQLAESLLPLARFPETLELFERHAERAEKLGDPSVGARYAFWLAHTHTYLGHQEETQRHAEQAIAAAQECGDETTEGKAHYVLGRDGFWAGRFAEGVRHSLRAVVLLERCGEPWWQGQAYWVAGFNHYVLGDFAKAIDALERARAIGEALDDYRLDTSWSLGYFYASLGEGDTGIEQCRRGLDGARDPLNSAVAMGFLGYAYLEKGDLDKAIDSLRESVERLRDTGMRQILGWFSVFLAEAYLAAGEVERAGELAASGLEITREARFGYGEGLAQRALGRVAASAGQADEGRRLLGQALATFDSLGVPFEVARTRLELARLAHAAGDPATAARELDEARRSFAELDAPRHEERVQALAGELDLDVGAPSA